MHHILGQAIVYGQAIELIVGRLGLTDRVKAHQQGAKE